MRNDTELCQVEVTILVLGTAPLPYPCTPMLDPVFSHHKHTHTHTNTHTCKTCSVWKREAGGEIL